jgi:ribosome-binding protein aMBF1 (putative translation factor)
MRFDEYKQTRFEEDPELAAAYDQLKPAYEVARQVIALRNTRKLSQANLAAMIGTKQSGISRLEKASHEPSFSTLEKICQALDARLVIQIVPNS